MKLRKTKIIFHEFSPLLQDQPEGKQSFILSGKLLRFLMDNIHVGDEFISSSLKLILFRIQANHTIH